ncbi:trophoblast glycoprotein-like [Ambystoma mexicanum]|uniref:trophoblast glycoprotein-like n=1 Tax=Ambystoma mexicanum TaxID=8296 RepID=UPI0037E7777C
MGRKQAECSTKVSAEGSSLVAWGIVLLLALFPRTYACPAGCQCSEGTGGVQCRSLEVPPDLPPWTRNLTVTGGNMTVLRAGFLEENGTAPENLTALVLADNGVQVIEPQAFKGLRVLAVLDLSHNALVSVASSAFWGLGWLQTLRMSGALRDGMLEQFSLALLNGTLEGLRELDLTNNRLQEVPMAVLQLPDLRVLDLRHNWIQALDATTLAGLHRRRRLQLSLVHNPFVCDCHLKPLLLWLRNGSQCKDAQEIRCSSPPRMNTSFILRLKTEELKCINEDLETASYIFFGIVLALIGVIFLMVLYLNRRGMKKWLNNFREACRDQMEGYHYRYEQDADPRRGNATGVGGL